MPQGHGPGAQYFPLYVFPKCGEGYAIFDINKKYKKVFVKTMKF